MNSRVSFYKVGDPLPIWSKEYDNIEIVTGMLAAGIGIMSKFNYMYYLSTDDDISDIRLSVNIREDLVAEESDKLSPGQYGIWLKSNDMFYYNLYGFYTNKFFQGVISVCKHFDVNFLDYTYGYPFDEYGNLYMLGGYVTLPYSVTYVTELPEKERDEEDENQYDDMDENTFIDGI